MPPTLTTTTPAPNAARVNYLRALALAFTFFNSLRTLAYLPNIFAIVESGRSDQHSLLTWLTLAGANITMAMWVYENHGRHVDRVAFINALNALMCLLTAAVIVAYRFSAGS